MGFRGVHSLRVAWSLHCSSFLGLPFRIHNIELVKPRKGTTMETLGRFGVQGLGFLGLDFGAFRVHGCRV